NSSLRTSSNLFVMNLTTADLIMSLLDFPMFAVSSFNGCWLLGYTGCQMYGSTTSLCSLVSINTLAAISFDRYFAVVHRLSPMHKMKKSTSGVIIACIWLLSITWSLMPLFGIGTYRLEGLGTSCTFNYIDQGHTYRLFFLCLVTFNFFIPLLIITYSYAQIFAYVKRVKRELNSLETVPDAKARRKQITTKAEIRTAITVIVVITIFCTAWTPYVVIAFIGLFGPRNSITPLISAFPNVLAKVCTISNPILYTFGNKDLRRKTKALFLFKPRQSSLRSTYATAGITIQEHSLINHIPMHS
ncbi:unnamed protein product, partial [Candidula unifasciata]